MNVRSWVGCDRVHRGGGPLEEDMAQKDRRLQLPGSLQREWVVGWGLKGVDGFFSLESHKGWGYKTSRSIPVWVLFTQTEKWKGK